MPTQEELIGLLGRAEPAWTSMRGVSRHWCDQDLVNIAFLRYFQGPGELGSPTSTATVAASREGAHDPIRELVLAVAADHRGRRRRADVVSRRNDQIWPDALVIDGDTFWARTGTSIETNGGDPNVTHGGAAIIDLLLPTAVPAGFDLTPRDDVELVAGRPCMVAGAAPRRRDAYSLIPGSEVFNMIAGGVDFRLSIDLVTGALLQVVKFVDGATAEVCEFTEIAFNETLEDALFAPLV